MELALPRIWRILLPRRRRQNRHSLWNYRWGRPCCYWCGRRVVYGGPPQSRSATREHLVPKSSYRPHGQGQNIVVACRRCNMKRGTDMSWEPHFVKKIEKVEEELDKVLL